MDIHWSGRLSWTARASQILYLFRAHTEENEIPGLGYPSGDVIAGELPHQQSQIEAREMQQVAFLDVFAAPQSWPAYAAPVQDGLKAAFGQFEGLLEGYRQDIYWLSNQ